MPMSDQVFEERFRPDWRRNLHRVIHNRDTLWYPDGWVVNNLEPLAVEPYRAADIVQAACETFGVSLQVFKGNSRNRFLDDVRQVAIMLIREHCGQSYPQLAVTMNRDQSSCRHAHLKGLKKAALSPDFRAKRNKVLERL